MTSAHGRGWRQLVVLPATIVCVCAGKPGPHHLIVKLLQNLL